MDLDSLAKAVQGNMASNIPTSIYPELGQFYASRFAAPAQELRLGGEAYNAKVNEENRKLDAEAALRKAQDKTDPSKYRRVRKDDGGFDFFDPDGNQIDIATYASVTGDRPVDIVKDSENPIDTQYLEDWSNLQDYISAIRDGDQEVVDAMRKDQPALAQYDSEGGIDSLLQEFKNYYKRYYVSRKQDPNAWGTRPGNSLFRSRSAANSLLGGAEGDDIGG